MALDNCPDCGREISATAKVCPHCGGKTRYARKTEDDSFIVGNWSVYSDGDFHIPFYRSRFCRLVLRNGYVLPVVSEIAAY